MLLASLDCLKIFFESEDSFEWFLDSICSHLQGPVFKKLNLPAIYCCLDGWKKILTSWYQYHSHILYVFSPKLNSNKSNLEKLIMTLYKILYIWK